MKTTREHDARMAKLTFASVYPLYLSKIEQKGRAKEELLQVIKWLTGFDENKLQELIKRNVSFKTFFEESNLNPNATLITGSVCGYKIQEIENPITKQVRYLDELVKGKKMEKILRKA